MHLDCCTNQGVTHEESYLRASSRRTQLKYDSSDFTIGPRVGGSQGCDPPTQGVELSAVASPGVGVGDAGVSVGTTLVLVGDLFVNNIVRAVVASGGCLGCGDRAGGQVRGGVSGLSVRRDRVVGDVTSGLTRLLLALGFLAVSQRTGLQGSPAVGGALAPVLRGQAVRRRSSSPRRALGRRRRRCRCRRRRPRGNDRRRRDAVRRRTGGPRGAHRLGAGCVRAGPHRLGHPVKVAAVDEDTRTTTSVEAHGLTSLVERDGHQRHSNHLRGVKVVAHLRRPEGSDVPRVGESVVDVLDGEIVDSDADDRLFRGSDVLAHLVSCLLVREVGPVEDLDCERVHTLHLVVHDLVRRSELQDVVPVEARLGCTGVDAIDVPLLVTHSLHQPVPRKGLSGEAERAIQKGRLDQRRGAVDRRRVDDNRILATREKRKVRDGAVEVLDTDRLGAGHNIRAGCCGTSLERSGGSRDRLVVLGVNPPGRESVVATTGVFACYQFLKRDQGRVSGTVTSRGAAQGGDSGFVGHVDGDGGLFCRNARRLCGVRAAPGKSGHEHQDASDQAGLCGTLHERTPFLLVVGPLPGGDEGSDPRLHRHENGEDEEWSDVEAAGQTDVCQDSKRKDANDGYEKPVVVLVVFEPEEPLCNRAKDGEDDQEYEELPETSEEETCSVSESRCVEHEATLVAACDANTQHANGE